MNSVNKTLYIPLYGKALVTKKGIILFDKKAQEIWEKEGFRLSRKSRSKWLAYFMGMRCAVFDEWTKEQLAKFPDSVVLHLGCGMDSRVERINASSHIWFDVDFEDVITERKRYYNETESYRMISADIKNEFFIEQLPQAERAIVVLEGVSMYLKNDDLKRILAILSKRFTHLSVLLDCYTPFGAKMSKIKNPIKEVGVTSVCGIKSPDVLQQGTGVKFVKEHEMTPRRLVYELKGFERFLFKGLYAGKMSKRIYKMYEYES